MILWKMEDYWEKRGTSEKAISIAFVLSLLAITVVPTTSMISAEIPNQNHITYAQPSGPQSVDPALAYDTVSAELLQNVYEPLCMYDGASTSIFKAMLSDSWPGYGVNFANAIKPSLPDPAAPVGTNQTWYFHIRENVPWHDQSYGFVTPADVEYSFERGMLMDHMFSRSMDRSWSIYSPQWMFYKTLLNVMSAKEGFDLDGNDEIDAHEFEALSTAVDKAIESNSTHVWFNLPGPYAPFQHILCLSWGMVLCKNWAISRGCWNGQHDNYTEFLRTFEPPAPGPLMIPPIAAMGSGPYKLVAINASPSAGSYELEKFDNYWQGWPAAGSPSFAQYVTVRHDAWANRKAMFFSTDPDLQADLSEIPSADTREMHVGADRDGPTYPCFKMTKVPQHNIEVIAFNYDVPRPNNYALKLGPNDKPDLFSDHDLRLAFQYCFNVTEWQSWLSPNEALQPVICMPAGTAFYNSSKIARNIDLAEAEAHFRAAWNGQVWSQGITVELADALGGTARAFVFHLMADTIMNYIPWPEGVAVNITVRGLPWAQFLTDLRQGRLCAFRLSWWGDYDYPDPQQWVTEFMYSRGDFSGSRQHVCYGGNISSDWWEGSSYGPPPYANALGETVTEINNTYVDHMIDMAISVPADTREQIYNELMDIYYAEGSQLPIYQGLSRLYRRSWLQGWEGTYNENPVAPGHYFYTMWKAPTGTVQPVDVSAQE
jgi:peptide/nickel transport system substrate-binding protein